MFTIPQIAVAVMLYEIIGLGLGMYRNAY